MRQDVEEFLEDRADYLLAIAALERSEPTIGLDEMRRVLDGPTVRGKNLSGEHGGIWRYRVNAPLIDPAWEPDELTGLAEALADLELIITTGFHTHAHHDHLLWCAALGGAPR